MANNIYGAIALIGGGVGALDAIDGTGLADKDMAYVSVAGITYNYILNPTLNQVTSSPSVIQPVSNPGTKDWVLTNIYGLAITAGKTITCTQDATLDETVALSSKATEVKNTFTPVLNFGGATTGITYATQDGRYVNIGSMVFFTINITLTSKGTATGAATITGLPIASVAGATRMFFAQGDTLSALYQAYLVAASQTLVLYTHTTTPAALTDANFDNTSVLRISGFYEV